MSRGQSRMSARSKKNTVDIGDRLALSNLPDTLNVSRDEQEVGEENKAERPSIGARASRTPRASKATVTPDRYRLKERQPSVAR